MKERDRERETEKKRKKNGPKKNDFICVIRLSHEV